MQNEWAGLLGFEGDSGEADFSRIDQALEGYYPQMERDLLALIACRSVQESPEGNAPFGPGAREALDLALGIAASLGLRPDDGGGYYGTADLEGYEEEQIGILCHLDVVPARDEDWTVCPPFEPVVQNGRIYGRGALDDKGPTIAALYAAAVLGDFGLPLSKTVRFIFGCNEESGMECVRRYKEEQEPPLLGFAPDGRFPLVNGEKGICHFKLSQCWDAEEVGSGQAVLQSLTAGTAPNIVPAAAEARFSGPLNLALNEDRNISICCEDGVTVIRSAGRAAHGSLPEQGDNALVRLVRFLAAQQFAPAGAWRFIKRLSQVLEAADGSGLGLDIKDSVSALTCSPNLLKITEGAGELTCDCRFPVTVSGAQFTERVRQMSEREGFSLSLETLHEPLYVPSDDPLAVTLLEAYREVSGNEDPPIVMGCGTYAKAFDHFLAFGAEAGDSPGLAHQADEYFSCRDLLQCAKIYARAIYRLAR